MGDTQKRSRLVNQIKRALEYTESEAFTNCTIGDIDARINRLHAWYGELDEVHCEIIFSFPETIKDADREVQEAVFRDGEIHYFKAIGRLNDKRRSLEDVELQARAAALESLAKTQQDALNNSNSSMIANPSVTSRQSNQTMVPTHPTTNVEDAVREAAERLARETRIGSQTQSVHGEATPEPLQEFRYAVPGNFMIPERNRQCGLRLRDQELPKFNGDPHKWMAFRDLYIPLVHNNPNLPPLAKFNVLSTHMVGNAAEVIAGFQPSDDSYEVAWDLIQKTYEHRQFIVMSLINIMRTLKQMPRGDLNALRVIVLKFTQVLRQLSSMNIDTTTWDPVLIYDLMQLLDDDTRRQWEMKHNSTNIPNINDMLEFLRSHANSIGQFVINNSSSRQNTSNNSRPKNQRNVRTVGHAASNGSINQSKPSGKCVVCHKDEHPVQSCETFLKLNPYPRFQRARGLNLCFGCLSTEHRLEECSTTVCTHCNKNKKHHRLLCFEWCDKQRSNTAGGETAGNVTITDANKLALIPQVNHFDSQITESIVSCSGLLTTALVKVKTATNKFVTLRALCDNGAQINLISEECVRGLGLHRHSSPSSISPVGDCGTIQSRGSVTITIASTKEQYRDYQLGISAVVMGRVSNALPNSLVNIGEWPAEITNNWADPTLCVPGKIDILLGAHVWSKIAFTNTQRNESNCFIATESKLGWLLFGCIEQPSKFVGLVQTENDRNLNQTMKRFFEIESVNERHHRSAEERLCEDIFVNGVHRTDDGRYIVPIPIDPKAAELGSSRNRAFETLKQMERKFTKLPEYKRKYIEFMADYIEQGHMTLLQRPIEPNERHFFIPHHGIEKNARFRVVFNGSSATTSGVSCNQIQLTGERLQDNLTDILLRFRLHRFALTGDIKQMYRQVLVEPDQRMLQLILWRGSSTESVQSYVLNTVTYGMRYAPHSAIRALQQCARDGQNKFPRAAAVLLTSSYVDDIATGACTEDAAIELQRELQALAASGGFPLCKWTSNSWTVLEAINQHAVVPNFVRLVEDDETAGVLGLIWNPMQDRIQYSVGELKSIKQPTKRQVVSEVTKLFDPTGLVSPVIIRGKVFIRDLWANQIEWDQQIPDVMVAAWQEYYTSLPTLNQVHVERWIGTLRESKIHLHGFCDASENAYAGAVYFSVLQADNGVRTGLLAAKTKVAPVGKKKLTIPRLELCSALLVSRLLNSVKIALGNRVTECTYWTDSMIALCWIKQLPDQQKTFISHRAAEIQELTEGSEWFHVPTTDNPADVASRGIMATDIIEHNLWWSGPNWIACDRSKWPCIKNIGLSAIDREIVNSELKPAIVAAATEGAVEWFNQVSTFTQLVVKMANVLRFTNNCKGAVKQAAEYKTIHGKRPPPRTLIPVNNVEPLRRIEIIAAEECLVKIDQRYAFVDDINALEAKQSIPTNSRLKGLTPFISDDKLLRVGGRLENAQIPWHIRHPIIVDGSSGLAKLIVRNAHLNLLHGGSQAVLQFLRQKYWITNGRNLVRKIIHDCVVCTRQRKDMGNQQMAALVPNRLKPGKAFLNTSIDYCGPFIIKRWPGRCKVTMKCYVAVFVCMASRAIHLETVTDLTTEAFLQAFQRFLSRRGRCNSITSDNATTFVGAVKRIDEIMKTWIECSQLTSVVAKAIDWHFIAPRSPHQGGLHEAAVKSFKHHLKRLANTQSLALEELQTIVIRIEGCLNSRPIGMYRNNADELIPLTPAHFLVGESIAAIPLDEPTNEQQSKISHWRLIQYFQQQFWSRWQREYINFLITRTKWQRERENISENDIVLIRDDNYPPSHWPMARVIGVHVGSDNLVRNVTLKHERGECKRSIQQLCKLPVFN